MTTYPGGLVPDASRTVYFTVPSSSSSGCVSYPGGMSFYTGCQNSCSIAAQKKQSEDVLDYTVDFSKVLSPSGDTIKSFEVSDLTTQGDDYDLVVLWSVSSASQVTIMVTSGHSGSTEEIGIALTTTMGRRYDGILSIPISSCTPSFSGISGTVLGTGGISITTGGQFLAV